MDIIPLVPRFILNDKNGYAVAKALEAGLNYFLDVIAAARSAFLDVDEMPVTRLDELAREYGIPYDFTADESIKRAIIRNAGLLSRKLGTREGLEAYLRCAFEGAEYVHGSRPLHFSAYLPGGTADADERRWAEFAGQNYKLVRDIYDGAVANRDLTPMTDTIDAEETLPDYISAVTEGDAD